jgi:hypothetical protein
MWHTFWPRRNIRTTCKFNLNGLLILPVLTREPYTSDKCICLGGYVGLKMIAREKDTGFGWKLEDFKFRAAFTIVQHLHFFYLTNRKKQTTYLMPMMHMSFLKLNSTISYFL